MFLFLWNSAAKKQESQEFRFWSVRGRIKKFEKQQSLSRASLSFLPIIVRKQAKKKFFSPIAHEIQIFCLLHSCFTQRCILTITHTQKTHHFLNYQKFVFNLQPSLGHNLYKRQASQRHSRGKVSLHF